MGYGYLILYVPPPNMTCQIHLVLLMGYILCENIQYIDPPDYININN